MSSFTSSMNGKAVAKWEKDAMADGYQLQYTTSTTYEESASAYIDIKKRLQDLNAVLSTTFM